MIHSFKPSELPSPPKSALDILNACADDSVDYCEITRLVTNDPQLTVEVLRMVNSAFYAMSQEISSLSQAISVIGVKSLRNLCLCLSIKEVFAGVDFDADFLNQFWTDSLFRAVAAKHIAQKTNKDPDECFTAGLLQDFGLLIMIYLDPDKISSWSSLRQIIPDQRIEKEKSIFGYSHTDIFKMMGEQWSLPESIVLPVVNHHDCEVSDVIDICNILNAADWFSYVMTSEKVKDSSGLCKNYLSKTLHIDGDEVDDCLTQISASVHQAASALGIKIKDIPEYTELLKKSNLKLAEDNLEIQELNWKLQETIKERDRLSLELDKELKLATEIQESLLPVDKKLPVFGFNVPAKQLSGDFYDYQELSDGSILFCLADVSGKGVNASLLMVKASSLFHCLGKFVPDLSKLVTIVNKELVETSIRGMFVTFFCGKYFPATGELQTINAGHLPALIIGENTSLSIESKSIPLGIVSDTEFIVDKFSLNKSVLYVYTDGITEAEFENKVIGIDGVNSFFNHINNLDIDRQLVEISDKYESNDLSTHDDMTILIVNGR